MTHTWENTNQYLTGNATTPDGFQIVGGKTGTTGEAGYCLVLYSYNPSGQPIISIVFKADGKSNLYLLMNEMLQIRHLDGGSLIVYIYLKIGCILCAYRL